MIANEMIIVEKPGPNEHRRFTATQVCFSLTELNKLCQNDPDFASKPAPLTPTAGPLQEPPEAVEADVPEKVAQELRKNESIQVHTGRFAVWKKPSLSHHHHMATRSAPPSPTKARGPSSLAAGGSFREGMVEVMDFTMHKDE
jgi:hypothetical protein